MDEEDFRNETMDSGAAVEELEGGDNDFETDCKPISCLICNSCFDRRQGACGEHGEMSDNEVSASGSAGLTGSGGQIQTAGLSKLKSGFQLLCKLLEVKDDGGGDEDDENEEDELRRFLGKNSEDTNIIEDEEWKRTGSVDQLPTRCCSECSKSLVEIWKLQELIERSQKSQQELVQSIRSSLLNISFEREFVESTDETSFWFQIRKGLIKQVSNTTARSTKRRRVGTPKHPIIPRRHLRSLREKNKADVISSPLKEERIDLIHNTQSMVKAIDARVKSCSVLLVKLEPNEDEARRTNEGGLNTASESEECNFDPLDDSPTNHLSSKVNSSFDSTCKYRCSSTKIENPTKKYKDMRLVSRRKQRLYGVKRKDYNCSEFGKKFGHKHVLQRHMEMHSRRNPRQLKTGPICFQENNKPERLESDEWLSEGNVPHAKDEGSDDEETSTKRARYNTFIKIRDDLIMYKYTRIKVCGSHLQCLQDGCGISVRGQDYITFQKMRTHILNSHVSQPSYKALKIRCPICNVEENTGRKVRSHLMRAHSVQALCESCWKPVFIEPTAVRRHSWRHKNDDEKTSMLAAGFIRFPLAPKEEKLRKRARHYTLKCDDCGEMFRDSASLLEHTEIHHTFFPSEDEQEKDPLNRVKRDNKLTQGLQSVQLNDGEDSLMKVISAITDSNDSMVEEDVGNLGFTNETDEYVLPDADSNCSSDSSSSDSGSSFGNRRKSRKVKKRKVHTSSTNEHKPSNTRKAYLDHFVLLKAGLLVYKYTTIKMDETRCCLICQESQCDTIIEGHDYSAFQKMRNHVDRIHATGVGRRYASKPRTCPLCGEKCPRGGTNLRGHLSQLHTTHYLCESCLKPVLLTSAVLLKHKWLHKSDEEKAAAIAAGESNPFPELNAEDVRRFTCDVCGKTFGYKHVLIRHKETHQREKNPLKSRLKEAATAVDSNSIATENNTEDMKNDINESVTTFKNATSEHSDDETRPKQSRFNTFLLLTNDLMMFRYTCIQRCGSYLKCLHDGCGVSVKGPEDYFAFQKMRTHITKSHAAQPSYKKMKMDCPLKPSCGARGTGRKMRIHLTHSHKVNALCESCGKPVHVDTVALQKHAWCHKNKDEKIAAVATGINMYSRFLSAKEKQLLSLSVPQYTFKCEDCGEMFRDSLRLQDHIEIHHTFNPSENEMDDDSKKAAEFEYFVKLNEELLVFLYTTIKIEGGNFVCQEDNCGVVIQDLDSTSFENIKDHIKSFHFHNKNYSGLQRVCVLCSAMLKSGYWYKCHLRNVHSTRYVCEYCRKSVPDADAFRQHMATHSSTEEKPRGVVFAGGRIKQSAEEKYQCDECGKFFRVEGSLKKHKKTHIAKHLRQKYECSHCGFKVMTHKSLESHIERTHRPDLVKYIACHMCGKRFNSRDKETLKVHLRVHMNDKPYVCDICGMNFVASNQLAKHTKLHHRPQPPLLQCELCAQTFKHRKSLTKHKLRQHPGMVAPPDPRLVRLHTRDDCRPDFIGPKIAYPCEICEKPFPTRWQLRVHMNSASHSNFS